MTANYGFVDRRCPKCNGEGGHPTMSREVCPVCKGTGLVGSYEELPQILPNNVPSALATRLRMTRERRKPSMSDLAKHFGWSVPHLSDIERGREKPTDEEWKQMSGWIYGTAENSNE